MATSTWTPPPLPNPENFKNPPPFDPFPLRQIRAGKIKKSLAGGRIESAIFKTAIPGAVKITKDGIVTDERSYEPHRHRDNALLHYNATHYEQWAQEIPASEHFFKSGGFGENMCDGEVSEKNICIGDRIAIGEVIAEVTQPRSPCYKLNHRFEVRDMSKRTQTLLRTGWLYRIIKPGTIKAGDMVRLLERPHPEWSVVRVMYYLFLETSNTEMMEEIAQLPELGEDIKEKFKARLAKGKTEDQNGRMFGGEEEKMDTWNEYSLVQKRKETNTVVSFVFESLGDVKDPSPVEPGSHIRVKLGGRLVRAYSVVGGTAQRFSLGVALDANSHGGSKYLHEQTKVGDILTFSRIEADFPLAKAADDHIIIAGGIGITAFLTALEHLKQTQQRFHLHYAVADQVPFAASVATYGDSVTIYRKSAGQRMDVSAILSHADSKTHIYTCGPERLMDGVRDAAKQYSISESSLHFEQFTVATSGDPFTAELRQSNKTIEVGPTQSLLDALKAVGMDVDSSCEVGNCGSCKVDVCEGRIEHRGTGLLDYEECGAMLSCVSRGIGNIVLDL